jgi:hypothetical protein
MSGGVRGESGGAGRGGGRSGGVYLPQPHEKVKNLFDAISDIEFFGGAEKEGSLIPEDFFTFKQKIQFWEVGFKAAFVSGIIVALLSPLMVGVFEKIIPVFGSYEPSIIDQLYVFLLTIGFSLGYGIFISRLAKYCTRGYGITKEMVKWLMSGLVSGAILKAVFIFLLFHFIYFMVLTPGNLYRAFIFFEKNGILYLDQRVIEKVWYFLLEFRKTFVIAAWYVVFTSMLLVGIPLVRIAYEVWKDRKEERVEEL